MPVTRFQKLVFGLLMAATMVCGMETYNLLLLSGGWDSGLWRTLMSELLPMTLLVMLVQTFVAARIVHFLMDRFGAIHVEHGASDTSRRGLLRMQLYTVGVMCPLMSLVATLLFKRPSVGVYVETLLWNLPVALGWQILVAGPLVRYLFRCCLFRKG